MIIKSFVAESASAALKMVREEMGGDAIVLKTRQVFDRTNRPRVELTACIEKASVAQASTILRDDKAPVNRLPKEEIVPEPEPVTEVPMEEDPTVVLPEQPRVEFTTEPANPVEPAIPAAPEPAPSAEPAPAAPEEAAPEPGLSGPAVPPPRRR